MSDRLRSCTSLFVTLFAAVCIGLAGCTKTDGKGTGNKSGDGEASKVNKANFAKVKDTMSEKEVTDILGPPTDTKNNGDVKQLIWKAGNNNVTIDFRAGKIESKASVLAN